MQGIRERTAESARRKRKEAKVFSCEEARPEGNREVGEGFVNLVSESITKCLEASIVRVDFFPWSQGCLFPCPCRQTPQTRDSTAHFGQPGLLGCWVCLTQNRESNSSESGTKLLPHLTCLLIRGKSEREKGSCQKLRLMEPYRSWNPLKFSEHILLLAGWACSIFNSVVAKGKPTTFCLDMKTFNCFGTCLAYNSLVEGVYFCATIREAKTWCTETELCLLQTLQGNTAMTALGGV